MCSTLHILNKNLQMDLTAAGGSVGSETSLVILPLSCEHIVHFCTHLTLLCICTFIMLFPTHHHSYFFFWFALDEFLAPLILWPYWQSCWRGFVNALSCARIVSSNGHKDLQQGENWQKSSSIIKDLISYMSPDIVLYLYPSSTFTCHQCANICSVSKGERESVWERDSATQCKDNHKFITFNSAVNKNVYSWLTEKVNFKAMGYIKVLNSPQQHLHKSVFLLNLVSEWYLLTASKMLQVPHY